MLRLSHWSAILVTLVTLSSLYGCSTELRLHRAGEEGTGPGPYQAKFAGIPYPLNYTAFDLEITHRVVDCVNNKYQIATSVEVLPAVIAPDYDNMFLIDPNSLYGPFKSGKVSVTYLPNGAVLSLNASADDQSGAIISSVVSGLIKTRLVPAVAPAPPAAAAAGTAAAAAAAKACPDSRIRTALDKVPALEQNLNEKVAALAKATAELKKTVELMASLGANIDEATKKEHADRLRALGAAQVAVATARKEAKDLLTKLTIVKPIRWPSRSDEFNFEHVVNQQEVETKWNGGGVDLIVGLALAPLPTSAGGAKRDTNRSADPRLGLPYRLPRPGLLRACEGPCNDNSPIYVQQRAPILQLGDIDYLICRSPAFSSSSCEMAYAETGELKSMGAAQPTSAAKGIADTFKDTATQYSDYRLARRAAEEAQAKKDAESLAASAPAAAAAAEASLEPGVSRHVISITSALQYAEAEMQHATNVRHTGQSIAR